MTSVLEQVINDIPKNKLITSQHYEGANLVIYSRDKTFFKNGISKIRELVSKYKKRIELRADPLLLMPESKAEELVKKIVPKSADITQILFEPARSVMIIDSRNPNDVIGIKGSLINELREKTFWTPVVRRDSIITSKITNLIRRVIHEDSSERRKFLNETGT